MALFQIRKGKGREEPAAPPASGQTVEAIRRRAVHRLIGASVLVVAGVIGFPLVFDNQPRPIPVDLPIVIPDKAKAAPLATPPAATSPSASASGSVVAAAPAAKATAAPAPTQAAPTPPAATPTPAPAPVVSATPVSPAPAPAATASAAARTVAATVTPPPPPKPAVQAAAKPSTEAAAKPAPKADEARKAQALLEGKEAPVAAQAAPAADAAGRFVVQVGAFSDAAKVREVRQKVEGAGLKTYTQVVETKDGSRTRVRVGPFADKAEATRAADKIRKLDLPVAILTL